MPPPTAWAHIALLEGSLGGPGISWLSRRWAETTQACPQRVRAPIQGKPGETLAPTCSCELMGAGQCLGRGLPDPSPGWSCVTLSMLLDFSESVSPSEYRLPVTVVKIHGAQGGHSDT